MFKTQKRIIVLSRKELKAIHPSWLKDYAFVSRHLMPTPRNRKTA